MHHGVKHQHINLLDTILEEGGDDAEVAPQLLRAYRPAGVDGNEQACGEVVAATHLFEPEAAAGTHAGEPAFL